MVPEADDTVGDHDVSQVEATGEHPVPDAHHAARNRDTRQPRLGKSPIPEAVDRQAVDGVGNHHRPPGARVARDGDGGAIRHVSEITVLLRIGGQ